jgi:hypothetical protein
LEKKMEEDFIELGTGPTVETEHRMPKSAAQTAMERTSLPPRQSQAGYEGSRFNAVRHGVLSEHVVLPWEDKEEYAALLDDLVEEYAPCGPTEYHLVEEIAGVIWRKRRLRLAEAASYRRGLERATTEPLSKTLETALIQVERTGPLGPMLDAVTATPSATAKDLVEWKGRAASAGSALEILSSEKAGAYEAALAELDERTRTSWQEQLAPELDDTDEDEDPDKDEEPYTADATGLADYLERSVLPLCTRQLEYVENRSVIRAQVLGEALDLNRLEPLGRYEIQLDRKLERTLAMLLRLQSLRRSNEAG